MEKYRPSFAGRCIIHQNVLDLPLVSDMETCHSSRDHHGTFDNNLTYWIPVSTEYLMNDAEKLSTFTVQLNDTIG